ncbi:MAG: hypothetical protein LLF89_01270 [Spirochaetaceae bacterium]|nr:hypothetical protein [Spirochaetaceae bacterium]
MKTNDKKTVSKGKGLQVSGFVLILAAVAATGFFIADRSSNREPSVSERWALYVQDLSPEPKLVVLSSLQHFEASRQFTRKLLAIVQVRASIELSAWADVSYYFDVADMKNWSVGYDKRSGLLLIKAPAPDCLPPAVRTETIEIKTKGDNLVTNALFRLKDEAGKMEDELSADMMSKARASLSDKAVRAGVREGLARFAAGFSESVLKVKPAEIRIELPGD